MKLPECDVYLHSEGGIIRYRETKGGRYSFEYPVGTQFYTKEVVIQLLEDQIKRTNQVASMLNQERQKTASLMAELRECAAKPQTVPDAVELLRELEWQYKPHDNHWHTPSGFYCPDC